MTRLSIDGYYNRVHAIECIACVRLCRLFIAAEVVSYADFKACLDAQPPAARVKGFAAVKTAGKYRTEGRAYVVADGDIIYWKIGQGKK